MTDPKPDDVISPIRRTHAGPFPQEAIISIAIIIAFIVIGIIFIAAIRRFRTWGTKHRD